MKVLGIAFRINPGLRTVDTAFDVDSHPLSLDGVRRSADDLVPATAHEKRPFSAGMHLSVGKLSSADRLNFP